MNEHDFVHWIWKTAQSATAKAAIRTGRIARIDERCRRNPEPVGRRRRADISNSPMQETQSSEKSCHQWARNVTFEKNAGKNARPQIVTNGGNSVINALMCHQCAKNVTNGVDPP